MIAEFIGEELFRAMERGRARASDRAKRFRTWFQEISAPPGGLELRATDGGRYTGALVVQSNRVMFAWLIRHPAPSATPTQAGTGFGSRGYYQAARVDPSELDPDDPRWDRDWSPYDIRR